MLSLAGHLSRSFEGAQSCPGFPCLRALSVSGAVLGVALLAGATSAGAGGIGIRGTAHGRGPGGGLRGAAAGRSQGYLGIEFHDASDDGASGLHVHGARGVEVVMVDHDGPAGKAGLRPHDIIVALDGQAIAGVDAFRRMIHDAGAGVQIVLQVVRAGKSMVLSAQLADRDQVAKAAMARLAAVDPEAVGPVEPAAMSSSFTDRRIDAPPSDPTAQGPMRSQGFLSSMLHTPFTGVVMETMEPQLANFFGAPRGMGLLVHSVAPNSPAAQCGLRAGDVVLRADLYSLRTQSDWSRRLHAAKGGPMNLDVIRDRHEFTVVLRPDLRHHSLLEWPLRGEASR